MFQIDYSDLNIGEDTGAITHQVSVDSNVAEIHIRYVNYSSLHACHQHVGFTQFMH